MRADDSARLASGAKDPVPQLDLWQEREAALPDAAVRRRIREDLDTNLLIEAGAGAGKTTEMVRRMMALVRDGQAPVDQIAAVTFTRKAAAELRERFQTALEAERRQAQEAGEEAARASLDRALQEMDRAFIGTIHAFCARLLRERPLEAGLDPGFRETLGAEESRERQAFWTGYLERLAGASDPELMALSRLGLRAPDLYDAFLLFTDHPDVDFPAPPVPRPDPTAIRQELEQLLDRAQRLLPGEEPAHGWDALQSALRMLRFHRWVLGWSDPVHFLGVLTEFLVADRRTTLGRWTDDRTRRAAVRALVTDVERFAADGSPARELVKRWLAHRYPAVMDFGRRAAHAYSAQRWRQGMLNFQDLLMGAARLLREQPRARSALARRYRHLLVDEFQDTDPVQAEVLFLLAAGDAGGASPLDWWQATPRPGALFVVGDPKQSIYRFRRADMALYTRIKRRFADFGATLELTANFRSRPPIEDLVNATFETRFPEVETETQAAYAPLRVQQPDVARQGVFWYGIEDAPPGSSRQAPQQELATQDAERVAAWVAGRVSRGERRPGDFLVITHRRHFLATYARALEAWNLPVQVTGAGITLDAELAELRLLLAALADPDDPILTVAVLVGLFFGLDFETLTAHAHDQGGGFRFLEIASNPVTPVERALATLRDFWELTRRESADVAVPAIVHQLGLLPFAAAGELGESRAGALLFVLDAIRAHARSGDASLQGALTALDVALESDEGEARLEPGRSDVVRVMNLHKAKGLESPVVMLVEPFGHRPHQATLHVERTAGGAATGHALIRKRLSAYHWLPLACPLDWHQHVAAESAFRAAEEDRLLYVAATRAKEEVVVGRSRTAPHSSPWLGLHKQLAAMGQRLSADSVVPPRRDQVDIRPADLRQRMAAVEMKRAAACVPSYQAASVTRRIEVGRSALPTPPPAWELAPPAPSLRQLPHGTEWGTAVHGALEAAARGIPADQLRRICHSLLLAADRPRDAQGTPTELEHLVATVTAVTTAPFWQEARRAPRRLVEVPFASFLRHEEYAELLVEAGLDPEDDWTAPGQLVEGVIDLAFEQDGAWTIVDYKSDAPGASLDGRTLQRYRAQVSLYAAAWRHITGSPIGERVLLFTTDNTVARW